jgi:hypothetical protein
MSTITYLFGAGASCHAMPIVHQIPEKLHRLIFLLKEEQLKLSPSDKFSNFAVDIAKGALQAELIANLEWLQAESLKHASVDTLAKKLYIKGDSKALHTLKICLSVFFICEQLSNKVDERYDSFYASLLSDSLTSFPNKLRILSWNYDFQFEMAFSAYSDRDEIETNESFLRVVHKYDENRHIKSNEFAIYKLNGTATLYINNANRQFKFLPSLKHELTLSTIEQIVKAYGLAYYQSRNVQPNLSFAWESDNSHRGVLNLALEATKDTSVLVIVGYSFPFFNREIDRRIVENMKNLQTVYFQSPEAQNLVERFQALKADVSNIKLIPRNDVAQFLLPNEL